MPHYRTLDVDGVVYPSDAEIDKWRAADVWPDTTLGQALRETAARVPDRAAIISQRKTLTFAELNDASDILAAGLITRGLKPGDRALFQMANCAETFICLCACLKAGVVPVCSLPQHREIEINALSALSAPKAHFIQLGLGAFDLRAFAAKTAKAQPSISACFTARGGSDDPNSIERIIDDGDAREAAQIVQEINIRCGDVAVFQLSGGSTGVPKIIPRFHGEYLDHSVSWARKAKVDEHSVAIWNLPIIHNAGMQWSFITTIALGRTVVIQEEIDLDLMFNAIEEHRVTHAVSIGPIAPHILADDNLSRFDYSSLVLFGGMNGADTLEAHIGVPCYNIFGITEGLLMCAGPDLDAKLRHTTNGMPTRDVDELAFFEPGTENKTPPGEIGELCFRGPSTVRAYVNLDATEFTSDGYFRTGDLMRAVEFGRSLYGYSFEGRLKDNINRGGEKFGAEELEALIGEHPDIVGALVVSMPCPTLGERACAYLILRPSAPAVTVESLGAFLIEKGLAKFKLPERIEYTDEFPVTRAGKPDKEALRKRIRETIAREQQT